MSLWESSGGKVNRRKEDATVQEHSALEINVSNTSCNLLSHNYLPSIFFFFFLSCTQIAIPPPSTDGVIPLYRHIGLVNVNFGLGK